MQTDADTKSRIIQYRENNGHFGCENMLGDTGMLEVEWINKENCNA